MPGIKMKSKCTIKDWILDLTILYINYAVDHPSLIPIQFFYIAITCYHPEYNWNTTHWMLSNNQSLNKYLDSNNLYFLSFIFSNSGHFGRSTGWRSIILKQTAHKKKSFGRWYGWTFPMFHFYVKFLSTMVGWDLNNWFNIFVPILSQDQDFQQS